MPSAYLLVTGNLLNVADDGPAGQAPEFDREAIVDLLGVLAYGELTAFERLAVDARFAPTLADKGALAEMAVAEFGHHRLLVAQLRSLGADPAAAMQPFVAPLTAFHDSTVPSTWLESLVKAYVGDGIATDFYREVAANLDEQTCALVLEVLADTGHPSFVVGHVRAAIDTEPALAGRLALWARRLVGEALAQAQRVAVERDALARVMVGGTTDVPDLAGVVRVLARITDAHGQRMTALGLSA